jgi:hypothetical protein
VSKGRRFEATLSLSLSFERARACANAQKLKGFRGLKNTRKNMCFLYLYLFLTTKTPQRAPLADVRAPTTPGRGGLARDGFESVVVFVRAFRRGSADDGETRDRRFICYKFYFIRRFSDFNPYSLFVSLFFGRRPFHQKRIWRRRKRI